jgi:hypothetical protein
MFIRSVTGRVCSIKREDPYDLDNRAGYTLYPSKIRFLRIYVYENSSVQNL